MWFTLDILIWCFLLQILLTLFALHIFGQLGPFVLHIFLKNTLKDGVILVQIIVESFATFLNVMRVHYAACSS